jgi:hypothetical protein
VKTRLLPPGAHDQVANVRTSATVLRISPTRRSRIAGFRYGTAFSHSLRDLCTYPLWAGIGPRTRSRQGLLCAHVGRLASLPNSPRADITPFGSSDRGRREAEIESLSTAVCSAPHRGRGSKRHARGGRKWGAAFSGDGGSEAALGTRLARPASPAWSGPASARGWRRCPIASTAHRPRRFEAPGVGRPGSSTRPADPHSADGVQRSAGANLAKASAAARRPISSPASQSKR